MQSHAVSARTGAAGQYGLLAAKGAHYGVDPHNPDQAREAAAQNLQEGLKWSGGDVDRAVHYYQEGPNTKGGGKENAAYPGLVMAALQHPQGHQPAPQASGGDDLESIVTGKPSAPAAAAPSPHYETLESIVGGGNAGGNGAVSVHPAQEAGVDPGGLPGSNPGSNAPTAPGQASPAVVGPVQGQDAGAVGGAPSPPDLSGFSGYGNTENLTREVQQLSDAVVGIGRGAG